MKVKLYLTLKIRSETINLNNVYYDQNHRYILHFFELLHFISNTIHTLKIKNWFKTIVKIKRFLYFNLRSENIRVNNL